MRLRLDLTYKDAVVWRCALEMEYALRMGDMGHCHDMGCRYGILSEIGL